MFIVVLVFYGLQEERWINKSDKLYTNFNNSARKTEAYRKLLEFL